MVEQTDKRKKQMKKTKIIVRFEPTTGQDVILNSTVYMYQMRY